MQKLLIIAGPTAVGKTALSLALAQKLGAQIINCDSRQIYQSLNIGTAKPTEDEQSLVPHHLIDCADLSEPWSVGRFVQEAHQKINNLQNKQIPVVLCGGTGMYLQKILYGLDDIPATKSAVRDRLQGQLQEQGLESLYQTLQKVDERAAQKIKSGDTQRILRALEVYEQTGKPLSSFWKEDDKPLFDFKLFVLNCDRNVLYDRINKRVLQMIDEGLEQEARTAWKSYPESDVLKKTIGYAEWMNCDWNEEQAVQKIQQNSRQFAKRQLTWFRGMPAAQWLNLEEHKTIQDLVRCVMS